MTKTINFFLLFLLVLTAPIVRGQTFISYSDTKFQTTPRSIAYFYFRDTLPTNIDSTIFDVLEIYGVNKACVQIKSESLLIDTLLEVEKDSIKRFEFPILTSSNFDFNTRTNHTINISSSRPINVLHQVGLGVKKKANRLPSLNPRNSREMEASFLLGNSYYARNFNSPLSHSESPAARKFNTTSYLNFLTISSLEDSNQIKILFSQDAIDLSTNATPIIYQKGDSVSVELNKNEQLNYTLRRQWRDTIYFSGGSIKSLNQKGLKSVIMHNQFTDNVALPKVGYFGSGWAWEDQLNFDDFGTSFYFPNLFLNRGSLLALEAIEDSTIVQINNGVIIRLAERQRLDTCLNGAFTILSSKPVYTSVVPCSDPDFNNNYISPFLVRPYDKKYLNYSSRIKPIPETHFSNNYILAVCMPSAGMTVFTLDGSLIPSANYNYFPSDSNWVWANLLIDTNQHFLESNIGFQAYHYTAFDTLPETPMPSYGVNIPQDIIWQEEDSKIQSGLNPDDLGPNETVTLCANEKIYLQAGQNRNSRWIWAIEDSIFYQTASDTPSPTLQYSFSETGAYTVYRYDSLACQSPDSIKIIVLPAPTLRLISKVSQSCEGLRITIKINTAESNYDQVTWLAPLHKENTDSIRFIQNENISDSLKIKIVATYQGCEDTLTYSIPINTDSLPERIIPNFISPNGDGINDVLCLSDLGDYHNCYSLQVFNRNGLLLFSSKDIEECWQPESSASEVYFYLLELGGEAYQGFIHSVSN